MRKPTIPETACAAAAIATVVVAMRASYLSADGSEPETAKIALTSLSNTSTSSYPAAYNVTVDSSIEPQRTRPEAKPGPLVTTLIAFRSA